MKTELYLKKDYQRTIFHNVWFIDIDCYNNNLYYVSDTWQIPFEQFLSKLL